MLFSQLTPDQKSRLGAVLIFLVSGSFLGCASPPPNNTYRVNSNERPLVDDRYSLTADRKEMEALRGQIPSEKKKENDELAFILGLMNEVKRNPSDIRDSFDQALRKKRELFSKDIREERETFTKNERKAREKFLQEQSDRRRVYQNEKHSHEEKTEFYKQLDERRSEYFSRERDRRDDFNSDIHERQKNFENYAREKNQEFTQDHRAYVRRYEEWKKKKEQEKRERELQESDKNENILNSDEVDKELQGVRKRKGTTLESGD